MALARPRHFSPWSKRFLPGGGAGRIAPHFLLSSPCRAPPTRPRPMPDPAMGIVVVVSGFTSGLLSWRGLISGRVARGCAPGSALTAEGSGVDCGGFDDAFRCPHLVPLHRMPWRGQSGARRGVAGSIGAVEIVGGLLPGVGPTPRGFGIKWKLPTMRTVGPRQ